VCANGSRFSNDPRVLLDVDEEKSSSVHSSGWKWFDQVQMVKKSFLNPPTLYDLQFYSVGFPPSHLIFYNYNLTNESLLSSRSYFFKAHQHHKLVGQ
jgi:hypothetical protein